MNFLTGKAISRRHVLKGLGTAVALPFLDAMVPASLYGRQAAVKPVHRFQVIYVPNGMAMEFWSPKGVGRNFELSPILEPLEPFRDQLLVLSGLYASWNAAHAGASGSFLNGVPRGGEYETDVVADVSMDQLLAREFAKETQLGSLEVSIDPPADAGSCSLNLSCVYTHTLSWRAPRQPLPTEHNPRAVFERLLGDTGTTERGARENRMRQHKSILDAVTDQLKRLTGEIGPSDRIKMDEFVQAVRDVERRIERAEEQIDIELPEMAQPYGAPTDFEEHMELMTDLQLLAFQTDLTRVITFMLGEEQSARSYPQVGVPEAHHPLSHHNNDPTQIETMSKINRYHVEQLAKYASKMQAIPDGDGSLLDNTTILYGSGISNSHVHGGANLPILMLGGGAGTWKGGRHIEYTNRPWLANLLVTLMDKYNLPVEKIGVGTEGLPIDTVSGV